MIVALNRIAHSVYRAYPPRIPWVKYLKKSSEKLLFKEF